MTTSALRLCELLAGVECRFTRQYAMMFKPKPSTWALEAKQLLADLEVRQALAALLVPENPTHVNPDWTREGWTQGPGLAGCYACGSSCYDRDPLGNPRHPWCGWIDQKGLPEAGPAPLYPTFDKTGAAVWGKRPQKRQAAQAGRGGSR